MKKNKGFTLIELLTVVAIIGILATVVLASLTQARDKAKKAKVQLTLDQIENIVASAQISNNQTLLSITGNNCSLCACGTSDWRDTGSLCVNNWKSAIDKIIVKHDSTMTNGPAYYTDPWGSPYLLDENEGETPGNLCRRDTLSSAGPNRIIDGVDDILVNLPYGNC